MLLEAQIAAFVGAALLLLPFLLAHQRFPSDFSLYWIGGWTFYVIRFLFDIVITVSGPSRILTFGTNVAVGTSAILILLAVIQLVDWERSYTREAVVLWIGLTAWTAIALSLNFEFAWTYTPLYVAFGVIQLVTAFVFYQYLKSYSYSSTPVIIASLVIWGLHKFDYPLLRPIESIAPYGYILGALLAFTTALGVMMFLLEDSERKAKEEQKTAIRRFEEYEELFNNIPDPVYIHDLDGNFLKVNDTAVNVLGYSRAQFHSMTPADLVSPEHREKVKNRIDMAAVEDMVTFDSAHVTADGRIFDVSVNATKITYQGQTAVLAVARDVTERKALEQRLSVVNRILRHDIRSAVNIIKGNAGLAMKSGTTADKPLKTVIEEADRLYEIGEKAQKIEGLLPSRQSLTEVVDLSLLIESKVIKIQNSYPHVDFSSDIQENISAEVSAGFGEAIENVLVNAIVHNDKDEPEVSIKVREANEQIQIQIADNGPGIPEDEIKPIETGEETVLQHSSGLGLWFVYWMVEESSGQLEFSANEPTGTIVKISVPKAKGETS